MSAKNKAEIEEHGVVCGLAWEVEQWIKQWALTTKDQLMAQHAHRIRRYLESHPVPSDFFDEPTIDQLTPKPSVTDYK